MRRIVHDYSAAAIAQEKPDLERFIAERLGARMLWRRVSSAAQFLLDVADGEHRKNKRTDRLEMVSLTNLSLSSISSLGSK